MAIGPTKLVDLLRELTSSDPSVRERSADRVTDYVPSIAPDEGKLLGMLLATLALAESSTATRESQLHAIYELADTGGIDSAVVGMILGIDRESLGASEREYLAYLESEYRV
jgi:hypothetical protein